MEQEERPEKLFDILYVDSERVSSIYAQLFGGRLESVKRSESTTEDISEGVSVGIPKVVGGESGTVKGTSQEIQEVLSPDDLLVLDTITKLKERHYIKDDLESTSTGDVVLITAFLSIFDASNLHKFFHHLPDQFLIGEAKNKTERREKRKEAESITKIIDAIYSMIPLGIQVRCVLEDRSQLWGTLKQEFLRDPTASLTLKHGSSVQGKWYVCGIIDALPHESNELKATGTDLVTKFGVMSDLLRKTLGRTDDEYGITLVAIFRELGK